MPQAIIGAAVIVAIGLIIGLAWGGTDRFKTTIEGRVVPWTSDVITVDLPNGGREVKHRLSDGRVKVLIYGKSGEIIDQWEEKPQSPARSPVSLETYGQRERDVPPRITSAPEDALPAGWCPPGVRRGQRYDCATGICRC